MQYLWNELIKNDDICRQNTQDGTQSLMSVFYNEDEIYEENGSKIAKVSKSPVEWVDEESFF